MSRPIKASTIEFVTTNYFATAHNALLAFTNLTPSNFTAHSTAEIITTTATSSTKAGSDSNNTAIVSTTTNSSQNNVTHHQTARSNTFEVPMWLVLCYCVVLLCAIVGNLLVISTLVQNRRMRSITNLFLLNLAISDILLGVFCMPVTLLGTLLRHFIFGELFCKLIQFSQAASVAVSSWTLVGISCERYYAICHPLRSRRWQTRSHAYKIIACIWCGSMLCMLPIAMFSQLMPTSRPGLRKCRENWPSYALPYERCYNLFLDLMLLLLPLVLLTVAYISITRTLYMGMRIEKAMIFGGKQEHPCLQRKSNDANILGKPASLPTSSSSRIKLNLSLRCHNDRIANTGAHNNNSSEEIIHRQGKMERIEEDTYVLCRQLPIQRLHQQHNFQGYHQQQKIVFRDGGQQQQQLIHQYQAHLEQQQAQEQPCCEPFSRFCFKRCNTTSATTTNSGRPHLYCMRFGTLKTTSTEKKGNSISNYCTAECCTGVGSGATNINVPNSSVTTPSTTLLSATPTASTSTTASTNYRHQQHLQHNHTHCYCVVQQLLPQCKNKVNARKSLKSKRNLNATESVLRRNNMAKNLESKKRVIKMLSVLVLEFFVCWTPLYVINTSAMYVGSAIYEYIDYTSISVLQLLAYSSSCCNPITYCFMNANFRRAFWDTFRGMQWCGKLFQRKRSAVQNGNNLYLAGSVRANSCTVQTVIDSPRL